MESMQVRVQLVQSDKYDGIILSSDLCKQLGIENRKHIYVQLGQRRIYTRLIKTTRKDVEVIIPTSLKQELVVPFGGQLHVKAEGNTLRFGPVIGILTTGVKILDNQLISQRSSFFKHLLSAQKGESLYYFLFTPADVNWETRTVSGMFLIPGNNGEMWRRLTVPFPDVVYNRIPDRQSERSTGVLTFKERLEKLTDTKMFNPTFFNKWSIHRKLVDHPMASLHIPETYLSPDVTKIQKMLKQYRVVYLKPVGGSLGLGILKLTYKPNVGYFCRYNNGSENVLRKYQSLSSLLAVHIPRSRLGSYLVQQGIPLIRYNGRPLDFRVHVHKNSDNQWVVAAVAAKIAGEGSVTTHVRTGGTVISGRELLDRVFHNHGEIMEERMKETAIELAEAIESRIGQNIGELGFDIGIDESGQIWMFEANSRPGRSIFKNTKLKEADQHSIHLILDYGRYLANFK